jgi:Peptidase A4 family
MKTFSGACAAILIAATTALVPALAGHLQAGHAAGDTGVVRPDSASVPAGRPGLIPPGRAGQAATPGYPDIAVPLPAGAATAPGVPAAFNISSVGSLNWSGYAVNRTKTTFDDVKATFFAPYLNCKESPGATSSSFWAGLDGYVGKPDSVEQIGIGADCSAAGKASFFGWFEMFPYGQTKLPLKVHAGDSVTASVSYTASTRDFTLVLTNNTRGGSDTKVRKCPGIEINGKAVICPRNSAEVIAEAPASGTSSKLVIDPLSDYGAVSFTGVSITSGARQHGGIVSSHWTATKIIQLRASAGPTLAEPTSVHGDLFDSYWLRED